MSDHVYRLIEVAGSSHISSDDAIQNAITKASETLEHISWFEVRETRGHVENGKIAHFQVVLKVGYRLD